MVSWPPFQNQRVALKTYTPIPRLPKVSFRFRGSRNRRHPFSAKLTSKTPLSPPPPLAAPRSPAVRLLCPPLPPAEAQRRAQLRGAGAEPPLRALQLLLQGAAHLAGAVPSAGGEPRGRLGCPGGVAFLGLDHPPKGVAWRVPFGFFLKTTKKRHFQNERQTLLPQVSDWFWVNGWRFLKKSNSNKEIPEKAHGVSYVPSKQSLLKETH